jgi:hypothetical protein
VLLLVVLSMLVLFAMIAVTFMLVAGQYKRSSRAASRAEIVAGDPRSQCDEAFAQLVRDTIDTNSVLRGHSLLADMYGYDGAKVPSTSITAISYVSPSGASVTGGQLLDIKATNVLPLDTAYFQVAQCQVSGYFNGCVLTRITSGKTSFSMRIVGWSYTSTPPIQYTMRVMPLDVTDSTTLPDFINNFSNEQLLINGHPYNGLGFGWNAAATIASDATLLNTKDSTNNYYYALLPNPKYFQDNSANVTASNAAYNSFGGLGGPDEDYDAPDPQNMALAYSPVTPTAPQQILPSFHRPDLIKYYMNLAGVSSWKQLPPDLLRKVMLRPSSLPPDHPGFTGSNQLFDAATGPWDVDNDGDGIAESVWIDVGFGVQVLPDGRKYKPLAAIYCVDLDGRLNVNAHGSVAQAESNYTTPPATLPVNYFPPSTSPALPALTRGQGYGTSEINLLSGLGLTTSYGEFLASRYAESGLTSPTTTYSPNPVTTSPYPGVSQRDDAFSALKQIEFPVTATATKPAGYGTAADLAGRGFVAVDVRGTPMKPYMGSTSDSVDDPYELDLSQKAIRSPRTASTPTTSTNPADSPFTPTELERILRLYDIEASSLPDGLRTLLSTSTLPMNQLRNLITTDSYDLPSPGVLLTREMHAATNTAGAGYSHVSNHIVDLLRLRLKQASYTGSVNLAIQQLLAPELVAGQRLDINRPFGNGQDDNNNGVVDEPAESGSGREPAWIDKANTANRPTIPVDFQTQTTPSYSPPYFTPSNGIDANGDGTYDNTNDAVRARQLFARHLYVLMMLLKDQYQTDGTTPVNIDFDGDPTNDTPQETARGIAQWAVNVVDFRDRDSIMTPFEYDIFPFKDDAGAGTTTWNVDGDISSTSADNTATAYRGLVWGCERPELLITETLAFHDRRTEDDNKENATPKGKTTDALPNKDTDFDQRLLPLGSLFVELYNPWTTQYSTLDANGYPHASEVPGEFYDVRNNNVQGVKLNARSRDASGNYDPQGSPVWRLMIQKALTEPVLGERKDPDDAASPLAYNTEIERTAYFVDVTTPAPAPIPADSTQHYSSLAVDPLLPGRYAVVGSAGYVGDPTDPQAQVTPVGRPIGWSAETGDYTTYRRILLKPGQGLTTNQVEIRRNNGGNGTTEPGPIGQPPTVANGAQPAVAVAVNHTVGETYPRSMSISEPIAGYPPPNTTYGPEPGYSTGTILDNPLDEATSAANPILGGATPVGDGTKVNFRTIHLQRLANPLLPWNKDENPYLTIDSMSVDLTVFNGVEKTSRGPLQMPAPQGPRRSALSSLQRGDHEATNKNNLWLHEGVNSAAGPTTPGTAVGQLYDYYLHMTLGYLNRFTQPDSPARNNDKQNAFDSSAPQASANARYVGAPKNNPFPWLAWNDRPFVGPMELMMVPRSRSWRLPYDFNPISTAFNTYTANPPGTPPASAGQLPVAGGHLLDFFQSGNPGITPSPAHFYRLFDYVQVPSRFVGTETELNPTSSYFGAEITPAMAAQMQQEQALVSYFHPPFNKVSTYREPGRVNINTIPSNGNDLPFGPAPASIAWGAILNPGAPAYAVPAWPQIVKSRQGQWAPSAGPPFTPSYFANPFRSPAGAALGLPGPSGSIPTRAERDVTLLRADPITPTQPLFAYPPNLNQADDNTRHSYFQTASLQRMNNLLTTRSNVYAVWITVGYFEVTSGPADPVHLDGFYLGQELGTDTGETTRYRAFYLYDRSIPVGFEPGKDHNFENGVMVKRFIE